jgi:two-component system, chemotaxis family, response regulator Rcp1
MALLRHQGKYANASRPDIIFLDLNLPKKDGREVLAEIKMDEDLKIIPVVVLTMSKAEEDILNTYKHHANCYITKPINMDQFLAAIKQIGDFWLSIVKLPPK